MNDTDYKTCLKCHQTQPRTHFYRDKTRADGYSPYCKVCRSKDAHNYYAANPDKLLKISEQQRNRTAAAGGVHKYDTLNRMAMSPERYEELLEQQDNLCAICKQNETVTYKGRVKSLSVDHDHSCCPRKRYLCGQCNRGLLCTSCNSMIGFAKENTDTLNNAIEYLLQWKSANQVSSELPPTDEVT